MVERERERERNHSMRKRMNEFQLYEKEILYTHKCWICTLMFWNIGPKTIHARTHIERGKERARERDTYIHLEDFYSMIAALAVHVLVLTYTKQLTHPFISANKWAYECTHTYAYTHAHIRARTRIHTHKWPHTNTDTHTHAQWNSFSRSNVPRSDRSLFAYRITFLMCVFVHKSVTNINHAPTGQV